MVPKVTSTPLEEIIQVHTDDVIDTDFSLIDNDSIDIYSRSEMPNEDYTDTVYGSKEEYNTLVYDIDQNSNENSGEISYIVQEDSDSDPKSNLQTLTSISKSDIHVSTCVCTQQDKQSVCLAPSTSRVHKIWCQKLFKSEPKVNPHHALDMPVYNTATEINAFHPSVIHASYLHSEKYGDTTLDDAPYIQLYMDSTVTAYIPSGLPSHTLIDTGCHKTLLNRSFYERHQNHFKNFHKVPFHEKHSITVGNGQHIVAQEMISLPIQIQDHYFEFLVLVVNMLDEYDFIIGLEATIQLEAIYFLPSHTLIVEPRAIPLYPSKNIKIDPGLSSLISISGELPCSFSSGPAIIRVQPVDDGFFIQYH